MNTDPAKTKASTTAIAALSIGLIGITGLLIYQSFQLRKLQQTVEEKPKKLVLQVDAKALAESGVTLIPDDILLRKLDQLQETWSKDLVARAAESDRLQKQIDGTLAATKTAIETNLDRLTTTWDREQSARAAEIAKRDERITNTQRLAQEAMRAGNTSLAQIYLINALDFTDGSPEILRTFADTTFADTDITRIQQAQSVLQSAAYRVPPQSVPTVLEYIARLQKKEADLIASTTPQRPSYENQFTAIKTLPLEKIEADTVALRNRVGQLSTLAQELEEVPTKAALLSEVNTTLRTAQNTLAGRELLEAANLRLQNLAEAIDKLSRDGDDAKALVVASMQSVEAIVNAVPGMDFAQMANPTATQLKELPARQAAQAKRAQQITSARLLADAEKIITQAERVAITAPFNAYLKKIAEQLEPAGQKLRQISDEEKSAEVLNLNRRIGMLYSTAKERQSAAYQLWTVNKANAILRKKKEVKFYTDKDALNSFDDNKISEVDQRLLTPETAKFFDDTLNIIFGEVPAKDKADLQSKLAYFPKKKLEDF